MRDTERFQVVVIGGGQAGLSVGHHLARLGVSFVILDGNARIGDSWRRRWDSLRLFSPAFYDGLPGMRFPLGARTNPTKNQMGDYLEAYAKRFALPVRSGVEVERLARHRDGFIVESRECQFEADQVVVAMGNYQRPWVPAFAAELDPGVVQLHSTEYRNRTQLRPGGVLVVGAGNSGSEIAIEVVCNHPTWLSGRDVGHVPFRPESIPGRFLLVHLIRALGHHILNLDTPIGRKVRPNLLHRATPLVRVKPKDMTAAGIERVPRVVGTRGGMPQLENQRVLEVQNVIWCTGFHAGFDWIDLPGFTENGDPIHNRGIANEPGLYFVGLHFLYSMTSGLVNGVGRDAERVVNAVAARMQGAPAPAEPAAVR